MSEPSFYVLSEGRKNGFSSHDTSRAGFHHQDLAAFSEDVNNVRIPLSVTRLWTNSNVEQAAKRAFPNRGRSRYETVNVCLIRWEDDELGVQQELSALNIVLQDYGFQTIVFLIPGENPHWDLMRKTLDFIQSGDNDQNLFILYYAGHGRMNSARQAEWVFGRSQNSPFVDWSAIQGLFGTAKSDVLILLDTCAAASSATTSQFAVMETIAACGFERRAPPPGEHSLTTTLVDVLQDWINKPSFSAASLHTEILFRPKLKETRKGREGKPLEWCVTPIHWINTKDCKASGIELCRRNILPSLFAPSSGEAQSDEDSSTYVDPMDIDFNDTSSTPTPLSSVSSDGRYKVPHVLITLQLEENQPLDARQCARWLDKFPLLAKWVKVEAVFPSYSTLMILSIPIPIWDLLPDHPACSFVGYITSPKLESLFKSAAVPTVEVPIINKSSNQAYGDTMAGVNSSFEVSSVIGKDERNFMEEAAQRSVTLRKKSLGRQKRAGRPKVKAGCYNCKSRRVKCDETRPECVRFVRSGRQCDGYLIPTYKRTVEVAILLASRPETKIFIVGRNAERTVPKPRPSLLISPTIYEPGGFAFSAQEGQYFQVFQKHATSELSGFFDLEFWTRSVPQESKSNMSIRHAIVALGALYKTLEKASESLPGSLDNTSSDTATNHYNFALQQYGRALTRLRESLENQETCSQRTTLISIVLFTCFQSFTGDYEAAISQIQHGLGLLEARRQESQQPLTRRKDDIVEDELVQMFTRLAIQAKSYDMAFHSPHPYVVRLSLQHASPSLPSSPSSPSDAASIALIDAYIPLIFNTSQEARQALDSLCERIMRFNELPSYHPGPNNILHETVRSSGYSFKIQLGQWASAFQPLLEARQHPDVTNIERAGIDILKMIHLVTTIVFHTSFSKIQTGFPSTEKDFDTFLPLFKEIVSLAKEVVINEELTQAQEQYKPGLHHHFPGLATRYPGSYERDFTHNRASFTSDLGIVYPLFTVATKCRDRKLRREAIGLLLSSPRREGMWDSFLSGRVARWIMEIEEEGLSPWVGPRGKAAMEKVGEEKRVEIKAISFDLQRREATVRCGTRGAIESGPDTRARIGHIKW